MGESEVERQLESLNNASDHVRHTIPFSAQPDEAAVSEAEGGSAIPRLTLQIEDILQERQPSILPWRHRTAAEPFGITGLQINPTQALPGQAVTIGFRATNNSDVYCIYPVNLKINGEVVAAEVVSLPPRTTLPMSFNVVRTTAGDYKVQVNDLLSKFTVVAPLSKFTVVAFTVVAPEPEKKEAIEVVEPEPTVRLGLLEDEATPKQKEISRQAPAPAASGFQSAIDKAADSIEHGLDRLGDAITSPLAKLADAVSKISDKKTRKQP